MNALNNVPLQKDDMSDIINQSSLPIKQTIIAFTCSVTISIVT